MGLDVLPLPDEDTLDQLAGFTGVGWTTSLFGFLTSAIGYGNSVVTRVAADPVSLLYVGVVFFLATLGLDRLAGVVAED
ncbi:hypothetical protein [Haloarcula amylovorans]|uniref:hypothetical protein n=1 Tax=Haloarcula amylovorans TaxID=2562280 RepID=UPI0010765D48|nr:hypothetical protein [Halomicroarcula amylolytica]